MAEIEFDPNKPFDTASASTPEFDPSKPFETLAADGQPSPMAAGMKQLGQDVLGAPASIDAGASQIGRSIPVAGPAMVKAGHGLAAFLGSITPDTALPETLRGKTIGELYDHFEQQDKDTQAKLMAEHPTAAMLGAVAGAAPVPIPGAGLEGAAGVAARIGGLGGMSAADTAVRGGSGEDIVKSGLMGAGGGALGEAAAPLAAAAKSAANEKMAKAALGNNSAAWRELQAKGPTAAQDLGRTLIDDEIGGVGSSAAGIAKRAGDARQKAWDTISGLFPDVDKALPGGAVSGADIAQGILDYAKTVDSPNNKALVSNLLGQADEFKNMGMIPMAEAQRLKNLYKFDWKEPTAISEATNQIKGVIGGQMETGVGRYADAAKAAAAETSAAAPASQFAEGAQTGTGPRQRPSVQPPAVPASEGDAVLKNAEAVTSDPAAALDQYKAQKERYGLFATAEDAAEKEAIRLKKNNSFTIGDKGAAGLAGMALQHVPLPAPIKATAMVGAGLANKLVRGRGNATAAIGFDKLGDLLKIVPETFGKYLPQLQKAQAEGGDRGAAIAHFILMQKDPEYQLLLNGDSDTND